MKKLILLSVLLVGCIGSNKNIYTSTNNERIWWREKNAPEWQYSPPAPVNSDDLSIIPPATLFLPNQKAPSPELKKSFEGELF